MMLVLVFVGLGLSLLALLVFLLWRNAPEAHEEPISSPAFDERTEELLERIFGNEDWDFLGTRVPLNVQRSFFREHREIAFAWLVLARGRARAAMRHHSVHARTSSTLDPALELKLIINYFGFQLTCALLAAVLWLRGPRAVRRLVRRADELGHAVYALREIPTERAPTVVTRI